MTYSTIDQIIGNTPLVRLQRLAPESAQVLVKLEGHNPASSVKDRAALYMINEAEHAGHITPGDRLIEATSGNTGIALAMVAAIRGYKMTLIMPDNLSVERRAAMKAYGAELILVDNGMEGARDLAHNMEARGEGKILNQFANSNNPLAHFLGTGPEIWRDTQGEVTHFVSAMGTTGTIMGTSKYLKAQNPEIQIIGLQPSQGSQIAGIRRWPEAYLPSIYEPERVDHIMDITQDEAEDMTRRLAAEEGIFCGASAGGAVVGALKVAQNNPGAVVVTIICDRGDRYLSTGIFPG
ncbi:MAG: cysteine synthase CysM [Glaciecola sp.]|jgi:cysteine synthase B